MEILEENYQPLASWKTCVEQIQTIPNFAEGGEL